MANGNNPDTDYALHGVITGSATGPAAANKRWWMRKLAGPDARRYARMLFDLPPLEDETQ